MESRNCHNECTPGYCKYFIDLGYNIDILMRKSGIESLSYFNETDRIRLYVYNNLTEIIKNSENLSYIIKKYDYILIESARKLEKKLYEKLDLLNNNNSIFVFHEVRDANSFSKYFLQNRIWTLGNMSNALRVNPLYFGDITIKKKNNKTRFFLTSTVKRNYKPLIKSVTKLQKDNFNFEVVVTGRSTTFTSKLIPKNIRNKFIFKLRVPYSKLYRLVDRADFIIILLDPKNEYDKLFKIYRVTGSSQLSYGFLKPSIINKEFADFYNFDNENSLIYENLDLFSAMKKAILLNSNEYKKMQDKLKILKNEIYRISLENIKKVIVPKNSFF